ncbi:hypothetical protein ACKOZB_004562 [Vibrio parahaemolyticus]|nr:hypothetical protein [Vibrio parahaemolyticus]EGR0930895.1 hypothetical protein [Vibrio parahaemolyticus]EGR3234330.1 hypothetical protein [Vibrio parahaemolyticus]EJG0180821.1 hypothetical protein [Vibrio parahaemolyticus]EJM9301496.1 hypothetical protein [Vibrio parahaemolyticus]
MKNTGCCKLCDQESILQKSHIIPRSIIKDLKAGDSQLYTYSQSHPHVYSNADPKELLLCRKCEQLLSSRYEKYGTELLKKHKEVIRHSTHIEFTKFKYQKWYLYYLSIIWRASVSTLPEFEHIELGGFNDVLKNCIRKNRLAVSDGIDIDEFITITMFRVIDKSQKIEDQALKNLMLGLTSPPEKDNDDHLFFFMYGGFLVQYRFTSLYLHVKKKTKLTKSDMSRRQHKFVRLLDITESRFLCEELNWLVENV